jgi:hypothetical protein
MFHKFKASKARGWPVLLLTHDWSLLLLPCNCLLHHVEDYAMTLDCAF